MFLFDRHFRFHAGFVFAALYSVGCNPTNWTCNTVPAAQNFTPGKYKKTFYPNIII